jgi:tetratricopeptide (TPR) repeat protein
MRWKRSILGIVVAVAIVAACARSPQAKEARYLERGKKEFQEKNYAVAIIHFKNAIQAQPRDAEPYYQLALAYLAMSDPNTAVSALLKATELNPKHTGAQLKLAELMTTSRSKEVIEEAQKRSQDVLNLLPDNIDALNVLAVTELRLGNPESAEKHLEEALRKAPGYLQSSVALAQSKLWRKDIAGAEAVLKQAAAQAPNSPEPSVYLGGFYLALGKTAEAEQQLRHALQIDPKHAPALLQLAAMQVRAGQADLADQTYRQISALPEKQYRTAHALYLFQSGKRDQALAEFLKLAQDDPKDRTIRTDLVRTYLAMDKVDDATKLLTAALKDNWLDTDALLQRARIYLGSRKYTEAQTDLNQALHFRTESAEAHYLLAKVYQGRGNTAVQKQELGEALKLDPGYLAARVDLARVLTGSGGAQSTLKLLDEAPEEQRKAIPVVIQRNWALLALGQVAEARQGVNQLLAAGNVPEALLQDSVLKLGQKDYAGSRASVAEVLRQNPGDTGALNMLVQSYAAQDQMPVAVQKVREYAAQQPASAMVQQFLGQLLLQNGDREGARKAFEVAKAANPDLVFPELALAELDTNDGKLGDARKTLSAVVAAHPDSVPGQLLLARVEEAAGKPEAAVEHYRKTLSLDAGNALALNNLAYLLAEGKRPDEALKYAQQAKQLAPEDAAVDDTLGWTYYQKGMYSMAVTHLQGAVSRQSTARRQYHLAMAFAKAGDANQGRKALEAALKLDPKLPEAKMARELYAGTVQ